MTTTFDIADYADEIAAMRLEQDAIDAEAKPYMMRLANALGLLAAAEQLRAYRVEAMRAAEAGLANATGDAIDARQAADDAAELVLEACRLVARVRAER